MMTTESISKYNLVRLCFFDWLGNNASVAFSSFTSNIAMFQSTPLTVKKGWLTKHHIIKNSIIVVGGYLRIQQVTLESNVLLHLIYTKLAHS